MSENKIKETVEEAPEKVKPKKRKTQSVLFGKFSKFMNVFGIFERNQIVNSMPFILFCAMLIIVYISNSYYAEGIIRDIDRTKTELKEKRAEYLSTMSQLMYQSNQSEVAKVLEPYQIKETTEPPQKLFITASPKK